MPYGRALSRLGMIIGSEFDLGRSGPGGWWIADQPEIHFGANILVPDAATAHVDRVKKLPIYARAEVIVDPVKQILEVKYLTSGQYADAGLHRGDARARIEPFTDVEIDLALIWGSTPPL